MNRNRVCFTVLFAPTRNNVFSFIRFYSVSNEITKNDIWLHYLHHFSMFWWCCGGVNQDENKIEVVDVEWCPNSPRLYAFQRQMTIAEFNRFVIQEPTARIVPPDPVYADFERFHEWHQKTCPKLSIEEASKAWRVWRQFVEAMRKRLILNGVFNKVFKTISPLWQYRLETSNTRNFCNISLWTGL